MPSEPANNTKTYPTGLPFLIKNPKHNELLMKLYFDVTYFTNGPLISINH